MLSIMASGNIGNFELVPNFVRVKCQNDSLITRKIFDELPHT